MRTGIILAGGFLFIYIVEGFTVKLEAAVTIFIVQDSLFIAGNDYLNRYSGSDLALPV